MLPICLGEATKIAGDILAGRKRYRFTVQPRERAPPPAMPRARWWNARRCRRWSARRSSARSPASAARRSQVPPMYSALKRDGQPLYKLARAGIEVERARARRSSSSS